MGFKSRQRSFSEYSRERNAFVVIFDSTAPEGTGEGLYLKGKAKELERINDSVTKYQFVPERIWINDEAKNKDGSYKHDIRVELDTSALKNKLHEQEGIKPEMRVK